MKYRKLRIVVPMIVLAVAGIAFAANASLGTLSSFGWEDIAVICPIGALGTMLASKTVVPRAVISLVLAVAGIVVLGRAFCGWVCPVPVWSKLRDLFKKPESDARNPELVKAREQVIGDRKQPKLTDEELKILREARTNVACHDEPSNARHIVLGGSLLSAAIFGFPVFCLICPVGLSFAGVFTLIMLFGEGDVSWSVVAIPVLLLVEVVFFRKWCSHICPIGALMSLVSRLNRTLRPSVNRSKCLETTRGGACGRCSKVCETGVDPRHPEWGSDMAECTKCLACVDNCPAHAISMPFLPRKDAAEEVEVEAGE